MSARELVLRHLEATRSDPALYAGAIAAAAALDAAVDREVARIIVDERFPDNWEWHLVDVTRRIEWCREKPSVAGGGGECKT